MFMDCIRKQTYQCSKYKLKNVYKTHDSRNTKVSIKKKEIQVFWGFPRNSSFWGFFHSSFCFFFHSSFWGFFSTREDLSIDVLFTNVGLILTKLG